MRHFLRQQKTPSGKQFPPKQFIFTSKVFQMNPDGTLNVTPQSDWIEKVRETDSEAFEKMKTIYHHCADTGKPETLFNIFCSTQKTFCFAVEVQDDACDTSLSYAHCIKEEGHKVN